MYGKTFGIDRSVIEQLITLAEDKIEKCKELLPNTIAEVEYLEIETKAVSSFIEYHDAQEEREKIVCGTFRVDGEYGSNLDTPSDFLDSARKRLIELKNRLKNYSERKQNIESKCEFLKKDIELLNQMLMSSPRDVMAEYGIPPLI